MKYDYITCGEVKDDTRMTPTKLCLKTIHDVEMFSNKASDFILTVIMYRLKMAL